MKLVFWLLPLSLLLAVSLAIAQGPTPTPTQTQTQTQTATPTPTPGAPYHSGLAPLPNDQHVPAKLLPPGAFEPDTGPSDVIFPAQNLTLRFNHRFHVVDQKQKCTGCHKDAATSTSVQDHLTPKGNVCDDCHSVDHDNLDKVTGSDDAASKCAFCHVGYKDGDGNKVAAFRIPRANMVFNHKKHLDRNIACQQCHGAVQDLELATRDQLPRMRGCFNCHQMPDSAARGEAKSACDTCHVRNPIKEGGRMQTVFATGKLEPPRWLHNAAHTPDWIERHKGVAANDSQFCANCHKEEFCADCHDGRVRPRSIHPNDYISMHPIEARQAAQKCTSCHQEQSFCLQCHQRLGVSMSGPSGVRDNGRFHPPKDVWSNAPRRPGHHAFEAQRNLNACVSCHVERDCVACHGGQGIGGGFNPHKSGFAGGCGTQMRRNPRPCFVCHNPGDGVLAQCR
jgi:Cytochrome c7 and related cytochrome c